jgi:RNA polymerase sigma factor (TIGR02999 family)
MSPTWGAKREEIPSFALLAGVKLAYHCEPCSGRVSSRLMNGVTQLLTGIDRGDPDAASKLLPLVYDELRRLAAQRLAQEKPGQTLQVTALVHEAYLRLVGKGEDQPWSSRGHFFAAAAEAMRRILVENARRKRSLKQGGERTRVKFDEVLLAAPEPAEDLVALDEALDRLTKRDPQKAELVKLRYFAGMTIEEAAAALGISAATAKRHWAYARAWLYQAIAAWPAPPSDVPG